MYEHFITFVGSRCSQKVNDKIPYGTSSFIKHLVVIRKMLSLLMVDTTRNKRESFIQFLCQHQQKMMEVKVGMGNVRNEKEEKNKQGTFGKEKSTHKKTCIFSFSTSPTPQMVNK